MFCMLTVNTYWAPKANQTMHGFNRRRYQIQSLPVPVRGCCCCCRVDSFLLLVAISLVLFSSNCHAWNYGYQFGRLFNFPIRSTKSFMTTVGTHHNDKKMDDSGSNSGDNIIFPAMGHRPLLAVITAPNACETEDMMEKSFEVIRQAVQTQHVDLVSIRLIPHDNDEDNESWKQRAVTLTRRVVELSRDDKSCFGPTTTPALSTLPTVKVVCSSDLVDIAVVAKAHGIHVKERHLPLLADIVTQFDYPIVIGTSIHSLQLYSNDENIQPHYYFVGTCYMTRSHPEKMLATDLEGPQLPGQFKKLLTDIVLSQSIPVFAIGGIDDSNCHEPIAFGADGVAVIRAVLEADDPAKAVMRIQDNMQTVFQTRHIYC
jgi:thiamine-phosphate diphosphorylase